MAHSPMKTKKKINPFSAEFFRLCGKKGGESTSPAKKKAVIANLEAARKASILARRHAAAQRRAGR